MATPRPSTTQWHSTCPSLRSFLMSHKVPHSVRRCVGKSVGTHRQHHHRSHVASHPVEEYTTSSNIDLFAGTYNVNGRPPTAALDLEPWLSPTRLVDIVAIGFQVCYTTSTHLNACNKHLNAQEVVPLNASNVVMGADVASARQWVAHVERYLQSHPPTSKQDAASQAASQWTLLASKQMVGVLLAVWVRTSLMPCIHGVQSLSVPTGVLGLFGNKGAVAVRLRIAETGLVIVCAHLSSGDKPGDDAKRNADYATIVERGVFGVDDISVGDADLARRLRASWGGGAQGILQHDHAVWVGDLNYRLRGVSDARARAVRVVVSLAWWIKVVRNVVYPHCTGDRGGTPVQVAGTRRAQARAVEGVRLW